MLEKFTVIDLIKTRSGSIVTFAGSTLKFNSPTMAELRFPAFVQFLSNPKDKQFAIRACQEDAPNAVKFSKPEGEQNYPIKTPCPAAVDIVRKLADWAPEEIWNVPGIFFASENAIVYDLSTAYPPKPQKGGWKKKTVTTADTEQGAE